MLLLIHVLLFWLHFTNGQKETNMWENRSTIVHLFEWKFLDVADECERFLQYHGYGGVQVSPVAENLIIPGRPWWEKYEPISYKIITRAGDLDDFLEMTRRCNAVGVRIYVDVVLNHMTSDVWEAVGTGGSTANTGAKDYPEIPYSWDNFNHGCVVDNYNDASNVRNCELNGRRDLTQAPEYVRGRLLQYLNRLIFYGAAGFRIDAAKHMWPIDLGIIYGRLNYLRTVYGFDPQSRAYIYHDVIDLGGQAVRADEYTHIGAVTELQFTTKIGNVFRGNDKLTYLDSWGAGWGFLPNSEDALVFVDDPNTQRGVVGPEVLTYKTSKQYKMAIAFMLAHTYGSPLLMSSFDFTDTNAGPPHDASYNILSPGINGDNTCSNGWICEHRWRQIYDMVRFRNAVRGTSIGNWWSNGDQQIAFSRGNRGFVAFTNSGDIDAELQTGLPAGTYCDVISGELLGGVCTGKSVTVGANGMAWVNLAEDEYDGILAIHVEARL